VPQVEVTFDIDANGILSVSATDKATGKAQSIKIQASSGLTDTEIDRMVRDAAAHADEDKHKRELIDVRNETEARVHQSRKTLKDLGENVEQADRDNVENKIKACEEVLRGEDVAMIRAAGDALLTAVQEVAAKAYEKAGQSGTADQAQAGGAGAAGADDSAGGPGRGKSGDAVDADYEVVDD
jgi:molecular chaperone DnaK